VIGGTHHAYKFEVDEYVFAALNLYIDIVQLFLFLLRLFRNND
jgi:FtsH-binding integral membrane protein